MRPILLGLGLLAIIVACGGGEAADSPPSSSPSPTAKRTPRPTRTASPSPAPTLEPTPEPTVEPTQPPTPVPTITLDLSSSQARQGGFAFARLLNPPPGITEATVTFYGKSYTMLPSGDRWFAVIGLDTGFGVGQYHMEVTSGGTPIAAGLLTVGDGGFAYESLEVTESSIGLLSDQAAVNNERATLANVYAGFTPERRWSGAWITPATGFITNGFGLMRSINGGPYYPHTGTDIANNTGTPIVAAATGVVALARPMYLYGNVVVIDHGAGVFSSYNHLNTISVAEGQAVTIGAQVGTMGETGFVSGPHLHWEAIIGGVRTDPLLWTFGSVDP
ncbi:MAG TPA: M23 family metallopeptidase [Dehalococcoidia bacterium]|nr:M23 family metallopeptidase [Dehalococcoidia bacterium]